MRNYFKSILFLLVGMLSTTSCSIFEVDETVDPNNPSLESVLNNPTLNQINFLGVGVQSVLRNGIRDFYLNTGTVGREIIYSASTDNRYFNELLGTQASSFEGANDPNGIFNTYYSAFSQTRRRSEIFARSAETATALTDAQKAGIKGFAKTIQGYVLLNLLNMQNAKGIRESFSDLSSPGDLLKPGPFGTYASGLILIKSYLDEGATSLGAAGAAFAFPVTSGWTGFNTPANFLKVNRAIAARVAMYQKDWTGVLTALNASFFDINGSLATGPNLTYSTTAGDQTNTMWHTKNDNGAPYVVFNDHIAGAEAGDTRVFGATAKVAARTTARQSGAAVSSTHEVVKFASNISPVSIIRNEELILMYAEANINKATPDLVEAAKALDKIRTSFGLIALATAKPAVDTQAEYLDELLVQRRYSLFWEGHRWFDARRYNRVATLPLQGTVSGNSYVIFTGFNRPDAETQWEKRNPN